jgi:formiminotetrahydrofolate cyclodeaminase
MKLAKTIAEKGNENSISDAGVAGLMAMAAVDGAWYNVRINLTSLADGDFVVKTKEEAAAIHKEAEGLAAAIRERVESKL